MAAEPSPISPVPAPAGPAAPVLVSPGWLALRERADAHARAASLVHEVRSLLADEPTVIHDLGCGTGAMTRWLGPQLPGPQHWVLADRDPRLLSVAAAGPPARTADNRWVTVETRLRDITHLPAGDLHGASLLTASALLDMMTADQLDRFVEACSMAGCPVLIALSVTGRVELTPPDPLDEPVRRAFNDHQRRVVDGRGLLGPDAVAAAIGAFERRGLKVTVRPSPWRLGPDERALTTAWLTGWVSAAGEQEPELAGDLVPYAARRLAQAAAGRLRAVIHHVDLLASPRSASA